MSEMKLIMEGWKAYIAETRGTSQAAAWEREAGATRDPMKAQLAAAATAASNLPNDPARMTVGQLKIMVKEAERLLATKQAKGEMASLAKTTVSLGAKDIFNLIRSVAVLDDSVNVSAGLNHMNIDDHVSAIVDNNLENDFLLTLQAELESGTISDATPIANLDMTKMLTNFLAVKHDKRTVVKPEGSPGT
jgi:hypothetical protein